MVLHASLLANFEPYNSAQCDERPERGRKAALFHRHRAKRESGYPERHETVAAGQSGVGKSSLLNAVQPGLRLEMGPVSDWSHKGRHTTRTAVLHRLDVGGWVVDTPGIRQMDLWAVRPEEVEGFFPEFRPFVPGCHFPDCSHEHKTGCAVERAVDRDLISPVRYASYLKIISGADE